MTVGKARLQHGINMGYLSVHIAFTIAMLLVLVDYHNWIISPRGPGIGMLKDSQRSMSEIDMRFFFTWGYALYPLVTLGFAMEKKYSLLLKKS